MNKALAVFFIAVAALNTRCATPPDVPVCVELKKGEKGWCTNSISNREFEVDNTSKFFVGKDKRKMTWEQLKTESVILPAQESWAPMKAYILTQCHKSGKCGDIGKWEAKANSVDRALRHKKIPNKKSFTKEEVERMLIEDRKERRVSPPK